MSEAAPAEKEEKEAKDKGDIVDFYNLIWE